MAEQPPRDVDYHTQVDRVADNIAYRWSKNQLRKLIREEIARAASTTGDQEKGEHDPYDILCAVSRAGDPTRADAVCPVCRPPAAVSPTQEGQ